MPTSSCWSASLFARLDGDRRAPQHVVVPTRLIARGSGEIRRDAAPPA
jgi:hypothetical protein